MIQNHRRKIKHINYDIKGQMASSYKKIFIQFIFIQMKFGLQYNEIWTAVQ